ncbi:hypothetical protein DPM19_24640 [Actinomadura craniellae]|uniref:SWIM-type domain-containing protein n=1 Tax=Actinomadura craniellae TaxID=2231787 RepID=A0A365GZS9_9ACTN|nr:SWIM zinc finger family protein [Actinomadura craniellae]RAY12344.1 hypothetical protein DPM19_24640 [Actinomadura craniellae]
MSHSEQAPGWTRRFVALIESYPDVERLRQGLSCAREGRVLDLRVGPHEVTARVRGSGPDPYRVAIGIDAIDGADWRAIEAALAGRAVFRARLLAGEFPPEIDDVFAEFGVPLLPRSPRDLHLMCDCPGWGDPCEHAAAVLYLLAGSFDDDPFLVLAWNGRTREQLLTALRRASSATADPLAVEDLPLTADGFWSPGPGLAALRERPPTPPAPPDLLLRLLDPPAVKVRRRPLTEFLTPAYTALTQAADTPQE